MQRNLVVAALLVAPALVGAACVVRTSAPTTAVVAVAPQPPPTTVVVAADPLASFAGSYVIGGRPAADGCGGEVYLAARNIVVDPSTGSLFADVVDRTYAARVEAGTLVAEGRFAPDSACPGSTIFERWTLTPDGAGGLHGMLQSVWLLPSDCQTPCQIQFEISAVRR